MSDLTGSANVTRIPAADQEVPPTTSLTFETLLPSFLDAYNSSVRDNLTTEKATTSVGNGYQTAFTIIICGLIIFGTILGNSLICSAVAITRKLRTPSNLLIVSLAISDLLVGALDMPFAVMYEVTGSWSIGQVMCDFWTSIDVLFCTASILNICIISIDRYLVITKPFSYAMKRTPLRMVLMIALVWVVSAIISIPPLFGWKEAPVKNQCAVSQNKGYQFFATIGAFYLPLVIMVVIYTRIYLVSFRMTTKSARQSGASSGGGVPRPYTNGRPRNLSTTTPTDDAATTALFPRTSPCNGNTTTAVNGGYIGGRNGYPAGECTTPLTPVTPLTPSDQPKRSRANSTSLVEMILRLHCRQRGSRGHERKATRTLGVIMGAFVACWLPFFILALIKPFCSSPDKCIPHWLNSLFLWLGFANSLLNPIIYARFNREFRTPFKYILQCRCANINSHLRSEDFTEQFGRLQASRHNSVYPPPLSLPTPPLPSITPNSRHSSIFPPPVRITAPSPPFPPPPPYLTLPMNRCDSLEPTPPQSQCPPSPSLHEDKDKQGDDESTSQQDCVEPTISHELSVDMDIINNEHNICSDSSIPETIETNIISTNPPLRPSQSDDPSERLSLLEELVQPVANDCDVMYKPTLLDNATIPAQYCLLRSQ